jgi:hypothetical protein
MGVPIWMRRAEWAYGSWTQTPRNRRLALSLDRRHVEHKSKATVVAHGRQLERDWDKGNVRRVGLTDNQPILVGGARSRVSAANPQDRAQARLLTAGLETTRSNLGEAETPTRHEG